MLGACLFHWQEESISEADLQICIDDVKHLEKIKKSLEGGEEGGEEGGGGGGAAAGSSGKEEGESYQAHSIQVVEWFLICQL